MLRKLTASALFLLMMAVTATAQGRLYYCLCLHTISLGECACEEVSRSIPEEESTCECCEHEAEGDQVVESLPHRDCMIELELEVGEFIPSSGPDMSWEEIEISILLAPSKNEIVAIPAERSPLRLKLRGPPDGVNLPRVPLFLRHSVFLL